MAEPNAPFDADQAPFDQVLDRLSQVVERLEGGDLPLEAALAAFEEGVTLSRAGARRLDEAERKVEALLEGAEGITSEPLESEGAV